MTQHIQIKELLTFTQVLTGFKIKLKEFIPEVIEKGLMGDNANDIYLCKKLETLIGDNFQFRSDFMGLLDWLGLESISYLEGAYKGIHTWTNFWEVVCENNGTEVILNHIASGLFELDINEEVEQGMEGLS